MTTKTRVTLGYAEEWSLKLLKKHGPMDGRQMAALRGVTHKAAEGCLRRLGMRGLTIVTSPAVGGRNGRLQQWDVTP